jgi:hypothetical protein
MAITTRRLAVYFVDENSFGDLDDCARGGSDTALLTREAIMTFVNTTTPEGGCAMCGGHLDSHSAVFVVMLADIDTANVSTLTSCVCKTCTDGKDIQAKVEEIARDWLKLSDDDITITRDNRETTH